MIDHRYSLKLFRQNLEAKEWLSQDRINFLINELPKLSRSKTKPPIGQYLKAANLLNDNQIEIILEEQKQLNLYFGEIAIKKGWLDTVTRDFFLQLIDL